MEQTYHILKECAPDLLEKTFGEARQYVAEKAKRGRPELSTVDNKKQSDRASQNGVGRCTQQWLDALSAHHPALFARVQAGELKPKTAARMAGIVQVPTPYQLLCRAWNNASKDEKDRFMTEKNQEGW